MRTFGLGVTEGQHYVYPGVRGPLLLPSDYIRKFLYIELVYLFSIWCFSIVFVILIFFYYSCDSGAV